MANEEKEEFKATVREAMKEILRDLRLMPVAAPVTEIIIRVGASEAVQVLGGGERRLGCPCELCCVESAPRITRDDLDDRTRDRLSLIVQEKEKKGGSERQILEETERRVLARLVSEEIKKEAAALEVQSKQKE